VKFLIIDDSPAIRGLIKQVLKGPQSEFVECTDGSETVAAYRRHQPDWVLMDINMPGVDGLSATRQLLVHFPAARVAIVTGLTEQSLRTASLGAGARDFVLKENLLPLRSIVGFESVLPDPTTPNASALPHA
jgi:CheY-like chemotaxis protein